MNPQPQRPPTGFAVKIADNGGDPIEVAIEPLLRETIVIRGAYDVWYLNLDQAAEVARAIQNCINEITHANSQRAL